MLLLRTVRFARPVRPIEGGSLLRELMILAYATAVGFAVSGMISAVLQLVTKRPVAFALPSGGAPAYLLAALSFVITGPYIVARASFQARFLNGGSLGIMGGGLFVAVLWSTCSGIVILGLALSIGSG